MTAIRMRVARVDILTPGIKRLFLAAKDGAVLPEFEAGAHIGLQVPINGGTQRRAYSLVNPTDWEHGYEIAVQLERASTGGSKWVHRLNVGDELDVELPRNDFSLVEGGDLKYLLLAGGIGITPILAMARVLAKADRPFSLHYAARDPDSMAYRDEVQALPRGKCWFDGGDPSRGIPLDRLLAQPFSNTHVYVCGPKGLIDAVKSKASALGWSADQVHSEVFQTTAITGADTSFEVELAVSKRTLQIPSNQTILDVMIAAGLDPLFDCRRGDCGVCVARVIDGVPDHRDICLSASNRQQGDFCPCVSRAKSARLILDI